MRRLLVLEQQGHQVVVEVGQRLQHLAPGRLLALQIVGRHGDDVGGLAAAEGVRLLADQIDVADQVLAAADRVLVRHHRPGAEVAQGLQQVAVADLRAVHLVDEDQVRDRVRVEELEQRRHGDQPLEDGLDHHQRGVAAERGAVGVLDELDRARAVENGEVEAMGGEAGHADLGAHLPGPRLGAGVADRGAVGHAALAPDGAGHEQHALEQGGLAGTAGPDQGDIPRRRLCPHDASLAFSSRGEPRRRFLGRAMFQGRSGLGNRKTTAA